MKYKVSPHGRGDEKVRLVPSCRLALTALLTIGIAVMSLLRLSLTISLVCMVKKPSSSAAAPINLTYPATSSWEEQTESKSTMAWSSAASDDYLQTFVTRGTNAQQFEGEFDWNRQQVGVLLAAYFYGFCTTQLMGGFLAGRFGGKHVFGIATLISSIATLLSPIGARFNIYVFIALRTVLGIASGFMVPTMSTMLGLWIPPQERSFVISIVTTGFTVGVIIASLISSQFCTIPVDNGWPLTFYVTGAMSFVFWIFWSVFAFSSPYDDPRISEAELNYIKASNKLESTVVIKRKTYPILTALSSFPVIAIIAFNISTSWYAHTQATTIPFYLRDVLRFDIQQNGLYTILPNVLIVFIGPPLGYLVDAVQSRLALSTVVIRKFFGGISNFSCALLLLGVSFSNFELRYMAVTFLILNQLVGSFARLAALVNVQDIAPRYAGEILGTSNTAGALTGILAPIIVGFITPNGSAEEWRMVFYIAIAILVVGGLLYVIFAKGEVLDWAKDETVVLTTEEADDKKSIGLDKTTEFVNGQDNSAFQADDKKSIGLDKTTVFVNGQDNSAFQAADKEGAVAKKHPDTTTVDKKEESLDSDTRF